jgi:hypothetical protein
VTNDTALDELKKNSPLITGKTSTGDPALSHMESLQQSLSGQYTRYEKALVDWGAHAAEAMKLYKTWKSWILRSKALSFEANALDILSKDLSKTALQSQMNTLLGKYKTVGEAMVYRARVGE